ncbi:hypothetical protein [Amycolatopsis sp. NPDC051371]|uniref:hypothetical protein n=1 Tax=Amycolatopsis sp. NPDC051371 TaxID=3155800 RepID=UPI003416761D
MKFSKRLMAGFFALTAAAGIVLAGAPAASAAKPFCDVDLAGGAERASPPRTGS